MITAKTRHQRYAVSHHTSPPVCQRTSCKPAVSANMTSKSIQLIAGSSDNVYTLKGRMTTWDGKRFETKELNWGSPADNELW